MALNQNVKIKGNKCIGANERYAIFHRQRSKYMYMTIMTVEVLSMCFYK